MAGLRRGLAVINRQARFYTFLIYLLDIILTVLSLALAYWLRDSLRYILPSWLSIYLYDQLSPFTHYLLLLVIILPIWSLLLMALGAYKRITRISLSHQFWLLLQLEAIGGMALGAILFVARLQSSRSLLLCFLALNLLLLWLVRVALRFKIKYQIEEGRLFRSILIVGSGAESRWLEQRINGYKDWGLRVLGFISTDSEVRGRVLGRLEDLPKIIGQNIVDEIIFIASKLEDLERFEEIFPLCEEQGMKMRLTANFFPSSIARLSLEYLDDIPLITFSTVPDHGWALFVKRVIDVVVSAVLLVVLSPFMLLVALLVKLTSEGPAIYKQTRCGLYGRPFTLYKFRSMIKGAEDVLWEIKRFNEMGGPVFKMRNDPRVTPLGRFLRKWSIDELPQFWNVLKGEMSLVGPRAPLPDEVREYTRWQRRRLSVKPGITCLWQVSGRSEIDFAQWMKLDLEYIDNWSLLLDFKILLKTIPTVLLARGAR